ncbi:hypothetical protein BGZ54_005748, partial [Gamsiella multidivaricata]
RAYLRCYERGVFAQRPADCLGRLRQDGAAVGCANRCTRSHLKWAYRRCFERGVFAQRPADCLVQLRRDGATVGRANRCTRSHLKRPYQMGYDATVRLCDAQTGVPGHIL